MSVFALAPLLVRNQNNQRIHFKPLYCNKLTFFMTTGDNEVNLNLQGSFFIPLVSPVL